MLIVSSKYASMLTAKNFCSNMPYTVGGYILLDFRKTNKKHADGERHFRRTFFLMFNVWKCEMEMNKQKEAPEMLF